MNFSFSRAIGCDDWQLTRISMNSNPVGCTISSNILPHKKLNQMPKSPHIRKHNKQNAFLLLTLCLAVDLYIEESFIHFSAFFFS